MTSSFRFLRRFLFSGTLFLVGIVLLSGGCDRGTGGGTTPAGTLKKITINQWGQALIYLPLYIAQEKGYFRDEGLDVTITNGGGDDLTWAAVTSGSAQFGIADPTMVAIQAEQGGVPGKMIGTIVGKVAFWAITFDDQVKPIKQPADFRGNTVACFRFPNTAHALALKTFKDGNLTVGQDVKMVEVNYSAVVAQLKNKEANIAMVLEPAASLAVSQGAHIVYSYPEKFGPFSFTGLTATQSYIDANPDIVQKVTRALQRALNLAHSNRAEAVAVGKKAFPELTETVISDAIERMISEGTLPTSLEVPDEAWNAAVAVCLDTKKLKSPAPAATFVENKFAKAAQEAVKQ